MLRCKVSELWPRPITFAEHGVTQLALLAGLTRGAGTWGVVANAHGDVIVLDIPARRPLWRWIGTGDAATCLHAARIWREDSPHTIGIVLGDIQGRNQFISLSLKRDASAAPGDPAPLHPLSAGLPGCGNRTPACTAAQGVPHRDEVSCITVHGQQVAIAGRDGKCRVYDWLAPHLQPTLRAEFARLGVPLQATVDLGSAAIATLGGDRQLHIWKKPVLGGSDPVQRRFEDQSARSFRLCQDVVAVAQAAQLQPGPAALLAVGTEKGGLLVQVVQPAAPTAGAGVGLQLECTPGWTASAGSAAGAAPSHGHAITALTLQEACVASLQSGQGLWGSAAAAQATHVLASATSEGTVGLWALAVRRAAGQWTLAATCLLRVHISTAGAVQRNHITRLAVQGQWLVAGSRHGDLQGWRLDTGNSAGRHDAHLLAVSALQALPASSGCPLIATASSDGAVVVWRLGTGPGSSWVQPDTHIMRHSEESVSATAFAFLSVILLWLQLLRFAFQQRLAFPPSRTLRALCALAMSVEIDVFESALGFLVQALTPKASLVPTVVTVCLAVCFMAANYRSAWFWRLRRAGPTWLHGLVSLLAQQTLVTSFFSTVETLVEQVAVAVTQASHGDTALPGQATLAPNSLQWNSTQVYCTTESLLLQGARHITQHSFPGQSNALDVVLRAVGSVSDPLWGAMQGVASPAALLLQHSAEAYSAAVPPLAHAALCALFLLLYTSVALRVVLANGVQNSNWNAPLFSCGALCSSKHRDFDQDATAPRNAASIRTIWLQVWNTALSMVFVASTAVLGVHLPLAQAGLQAATETCRQQPFNMEALPSAGSGEPEAFGSTAVGALAWSIPVASACIAAGLLAATTLFVLAVLQPMFYRGAVNVMFVAMMLALVFLNWTSTAVWTDALRTASANDCFEQTVHRHGLTATAWLLAAIRSPAAQHLLGLPLVLFRVAAGVRVSGVAGGTLLTTASAASLLLGGSSALLMGRRCIKYAFFSGGREPPRSCWGVLCEAARGSAAEARAWRRRWKAKQGAPHRDVQLLCTHHPVAARVGVYRVMLAARQAENVPRLCRANAVPGLVAFLRQQQCAERDEGQVMHAFSALGNIAKAQVLQAHPSASVPRRGAGEAAWDVVQGFTRQVLPPLLCPTAWSVPFDARRAAQRHLLVPVQWTVAQQGDTWEGLARRHNLPNADFLKSWNAAGDWRHAHRWRNEDVMVMQACPEEPLPGQLVAVRPPTPIHQMEWHKLGSALTHHLLRRPGEFTHHRMIVLVALKNFVARKLPACGYLTQTLHAAGVSSALVTFLRAYRPWQVLPTLAEAYPTSPAVHRMIATFQSLCSKAQPWPVADVWQCEAERDSEEDPGHRMSVAATMPPTPLTPPPAVARAIAHLHSAGQLHHRDLQQWVLDLGPSLVEAAPDKAVCAVVSGEPEAAAQEPPRRVETAAAATARLPRRPPLLRAASITAGSAMGSLAALLGHIMPNLQVASSGHSLPPSLSGELTEAAFARRVEVRIMQRTTSDLLSVLRSMCAAVKGAPLWKYTLAHTGALRALLDLCAVPTPARRVGGKNVHPWLSAWQSMAMMAVKQLCFHSVHSDAEAVVLAKHLVSQLRARDISTSGNTVLLPRLQRSSTHVLPCIQAFGHAHQHMPEAGKAMTPPDTATYIRACLREWGPERVDQAIDLSCWPGDPTEDCIDLERWTAAGRDLPASAVGESPPQSSDGSQQALDAWRAAHFVRRLNARMCFAEGALGTAVRHVMPACWPAASPPGLARDQRGQLSAHEHATRFQALQIVFVLLSEPSIRRESGTLQQVLRPLVAALAAALSQRLPEGGGATKRAARCAHMLIDSAGGGQFTSVPDRELAYVLLCLCVVVADTSIKLQSWQVCVEQPNLAAVVQQLLAGAPPVEELLHTVLPGQRGACLDSTELQAVANLAPALQRRRARGGSRTSLPHAQGPLPTPPSSSPGHELLQQARPFRHEAYEWVPGRRAEAGLSETATLSDSAGLRRRTQAAHEPRLAPDAVTASRGMKRVPSTPHQKLAWESQTQSRKTPRLGPAREPGPSPHQHRRKGTKRANRESNTQPHPGLRRSKRIRNLNGGR